MLLDAPNIGFAVLSALDTSPRIAATKKQYIYTNLYLRSDLINRLGTYPPRGRISLNALHPDPLLGLDTTYYSSSFFPFHINQSPSYK